MILGIALLYGGALRAHAGNVPSAAMRSFSFPLSFANGVAGDLISPAGTTSSLRIEGVAKVAVGELPVPLPERRSRRGGSSRGSGFVRPANGTPYVRLLLNGVIDSNGHPASSIGNQLVVDVLVSPSGAVTSEPPFTFAFDISNGGAFLSAALPIQLTDSTARVQILGVTLIDPDGQPFGVLGFEVPAAHPTAVPSGTPTPGGTPAVEGQCYVGADCSGQSFAASQAKCCHFISGSNGTVLLTTSWCPPDQFDPATGQCRIHACVACAAPTPAVACADRSVCAGDCTLQCPDGHARGGVCEQGHACQCNATCEVPPTPTPAACAGSANCTGSCAVTCADGAVVAGQCAAGHHGECGCTAECAAPTPCAVGQCFDTITSHCTGQTCGGDLRCPLPNQLCDVTGRRCACAGPPLPHGRICCQCKDPATACFEISFVEVQPICPFGCTTFNGQECDPHTGTCGPPTPCSRDADCDDGNGCTIDHCTPDGCTHDCVCVGHAGCGPGPGGSPHH